MEIFQTWNKVDFDLELKGFRNRIEIKEEGACVSVSHNYSSEEAQEVALNARERIVREYPSIRLYKSLTLIGMCGEKSSSEVGPSIKGCTNAESFKQIFGKNIQRGFAGVFAFPFPLEIYFKWHQTGSLIVPNNLSDLIEEAYVSRTGRGAFREVQFWTPNKAKDYKRFRQN